MSRIKGIRSSATLIVAMVALVAALGGGAVAGVTVSKLNNKEKKQVKRIAKRKAERLDRKIATKPGPQGPRGERGPRGPLGPTEGTGPDPGSPLVAQDRRDADSFTTTIPGRAFVFKPVSLINALCSNRVEIDAWLEVDGIEVPGSRTLLSDGTFQEGRIFSGLTANPLSPGEHTAEMAFRCVSGSLTALATDNSAGVSAIVLGG